MSVRASDLPFEAVRAPAEALVLKRVVLWALLASKVVAGWGVQWDIQWHVVIGRDSFWIPPHLMTYAGVSAAVILSFGMLLLCKYECISARAQPEVPFPAVG